MADVDAYADAKRGQFCVGDTRLEPLADRLSGGEGVRRVLAPREGRAENRHEAVAQELVYDAMAPIDLVHHEGKEIVQQFDHLLG